MANEEGKAQCQINVFLEHGEMWHRVGTAEGWIKSKYIWMCLPLAGVRPIWLVKLWHRINSESSCLGMQLKLGGKPHLMLNTDMRPIANKYREGKLKRTLKREWTSTWNRWGANAKVIKSYMIFSWCFWINALIIWRRWDGLSALDSSFEKVAKLA